MQQPWRVHVTPIKKIKEHRCLIACEAQFPCSLTIGKPLLLLFQDGLCRSRRSWLSSWPQQSEQILPRGKRMIETKASEGTSLPFFYNFFVFAFVENILYLPACASVSFCLMLKMRCFSSCKDANRVKTEYFWVVLFWKIVQKDKWNICLLFNVVKDFDEILAPQAVRQTCTQNKRSKWRCETFKLEQSEAEAE